MKHIILILLIILISSCGTQNTKPDINNIVGYESARYHYQQQNFEKAAIEFELLFDKHKSPEFALFAADSYLQLYQYDKSEQLISMINLRNHNLYPLIKAELFLHDNQFQASNSILSNLSIDESNPLWKRFMMLRAKIELAGNQPLEAAKTLINLSKYENDIQISDEIINILLQIPETQLAEALFDINISSLEQGWLEAAYISNSADQDSINDWQRRWPNHPGKIFFSQINSYKNIAVLLPLSGRYKNISKSIQQGMIASLYRNGSFGQRLNFFDTGSDGENFSYAWFGAIESGADFVIGPLEKKSIQQFESYNSNTIPVMLLNNVENAVEGVNFYQFSLSTDDEISTVAEKLVVDNKKRVTVLAAESPTSREQAVEFEKHLIQNGGEVVSYEFFPGSIHDYSRELKQALGLNDSLIRARKLQTLISHPLNTSEQIRPDIDAVFLLANPKQARLIKPQLKFFKAEDLPVYSTSQIMSISQEPELDKDLEGVMFSQSHFVTSPKSVQPYLNFDAVQITDNRKFFAFGYDAIALSNRLNWMQRLKNQQVNGLSGKINVDINGVIHRETGWAKYRNGKAEIVEETF